MKRGLLFGVGSGLVLNIPAGLSEIIWDRGCTFTLNGQCQRGAVFLLVALSVPLGVLAIWRALEAAPNQSWPHAILGWLIGFFIENLAWFALFSAAVASGLLFVSYEKKALLSVSLLLA